MTCRYQDPFLWQDKRGHYHVLGHVFVSASCGKLNDPSSVSAPCNFISGHAFSRTGLGNWTLSPAEPFSFNLTYDDGTTGLLSTRGAWPYNRPCAQQYVGKSQSCMFIIGRFIVHAPVERPKLLLDPTTAEPSHLITAAAPMPPGACLSCTKPRKDRDAKSCVGCKTCAPWDLQVFTMVTPLRQQREGAGSV